MLPDKLGNKVSTKIRAELYGNFERMNKDILDTAITEILKSGAAGMASNIFAQPDVKDTLTELLAEANRQAKM